MRNLKLILPVVLFMALGLSFTNDLSAQHYQGKFRYQPSLAEFDNFIIVPTAQKKSEGILVQGFVASGEIWYGRATLSDSKSTDRFKERLKKQVKVDRVYTLAIDFQGEQWEYFLLAMINDQGSVFYTVAESVNDDISTIRPVKVNNFGDRAGLSSL